MAQVAAPILALIPSGGESCVTGLVPVAPGSNALSAGPKTIGGLTSVATSNIVSTASGNGVVAIVGNTVAGVSSLASDGVSTLTNGFPGFTNSIVLSCAYGDIMVSPASNGIEVPVDRKFRLYQTNAMLFYNLADHACNPLRSRICSILLHRSVF